MAAKTDKSYSAIIGQASSGFKETGLDDDLTSLALSNLKDWLKRDKFQGLIEPSDYRPLLVQLIKNQNWDLVVDSFRQLIPFGTGGRRGSVGLGPNRINPYTLACSIYGHIDYLRAQYPHKQQLAVVLAFDVRAFHDLRGNYPSSVTNPLLGLTSKDLAELALAIYSAHDILVYHLPDSSSDYLSTPELSFLVRHLKAQAGLNISASHNHPDDNGSKFYDHHGALLTAPTDQELTNIIEAIGSLPSKQATANYDLVKPIKASYRRAFIDLNLNLRLKSQIGAAKFVFTGLHGTGVATVGRCLEVMGYLKAGQLSYQEQQCQSRSDFKYVKYCNPNPESEDSLELGIEQAQQTGADLLLATDPDADRLGGAALHQGDYHFLSGNAIATVLSRYRLESLREAGKLAGRPLVIKTLVTTELVTKIARDYGCLVFADLPVGFKFIGEVLNKLETDGHYRGTKADLSQFVIGVEDSHGFLLTADIRDKDAAGAAVVLAELMDDLAQANKSLVDYLFETYQKYGYHSNLLRRIVLPGAQGSSSIAQIQNQLRQHPPQQLADRAVKNVVDYHDQALFGRFLSETDKAARNMLVYELEAGWRVVIRPSGTEPQIKICFESCLDAQDLPKQFASLAESCQRADELLYDFSSQVVTEVLALAGIELASYGVAISDAIALPLKLDFCSKFLPQFEERAQADQPDLLNWVQAYLQTHYNQVTKDPFSLAFGAYLKQSTADQTTKQTQTDVWDRLV